MKSAGRGEEPGDRFCGPDRVACAVEPTSRTLSRRAPLHPGGVARAVRAAAPWAGPSGRRHGRQIEKSCCSSTPGSGSALIAYQTTTPRYTIGIFSASIRKTNPHASPDIRRLYPGAGRRIQRRRIRTACSPMVRAPPAARRRARAARARAPHRGEGPRAQGDLDELARRAGDPHPHRALAHGQARRASARAAAAGVVPATGPTSPPGKTYEYASPHSARCACSSQYAMVDGAVEAVGGRVDRSDIGGRLIRGRVEPRRAGEREAAASPARARAGRRGRSRPAGSHRSPSAGGAPYPTRHRAASARLRDPVARPRRTGRRGTSRRRASTRQTNPTPRPSSSATYPTPVARTCRCRIENTSSEGAGASNPRGANTCRSRR